MADANYPLSADDGLDDLPRTLRREKEARARAKRNDEPTRSQETVSPSDFGPDFDQPPIAVDPGYGVETAAPLPAEVQRLDIPFLHLMVFFLKAVLASVPALILLGAILWGLGQALQSYFPWLVKMQIFIHFPQ